MSQFRTTFFGGYRREEVDEYVGNLVTQLEQMKKMQEEHTKQLADIEAECAKKLADAEAEYASKEKGISQRLADVEAEYVSKEKELAQRLADMEAKYAAKEKEYAERLVELEVNHTSKDEGYSQRLADLEAEYAAKRREYQEKIVELEEKLREQDGKHDAMTRIMVLAEQEAKAITGKAYMQADEYRKQVENDLLARKREAEEEVAKAHQLEAQYAEAINRTCSQLTGLYASLGELIQRMSADFPIKDSFLGQGEAEKDKRLGGYGSHVIGMKPRRPADF